MADKWKCSLTGNKENTENTEVTIEFEIECSEHIAYSILWNILLGLEKGGWTIGGGIAKVKNEEG